MTGRLEDIEETVGSPEDTFNKAKGLFSDIFDKYKDLEQLDKALKDLIQDLPREDTQTIKDQQDALQSQWEDLCKRAKACSSQLSDSVSNWQKYQGAVEQMVLWLDMAEPRLAPEASSCSSLDQVEKRLADMQDLKKGLQENAPLMDSILPFVP
ncbi:uncharacterized protein [Amphiura filiformis]|uniref:uncharacterized protein n=1 Tax=Amphiura filiformis TaxID=82378 RepID=UPI003B218C2F